MRHVDRCWLINLMLWFCRYYTALEETQSQSQTSVENEISRIHEQINSLNGQVKSWEQKLKETTKKLEIAKKHVSLSH